MDVGVEILSPALPQVRAGALRVLAVANEQRSAALPDVPTAAESGIAELRGFALDNYYGFMTPPGTPAAIQRKLEADVLAVAGTFGNPDMKTRMETSGLEPFVMSSTEMIKLIRSDAERLGAIAKAANIQPE